MSFGEKTRSKLARTPEMIWMHSFLCSLGSSRLVNHGWHMLNYDEFMLNCIGQKLCPRKDCVCFFDGETIPKIPTPWPHGDGPTGSVGPAHNPQCMSVFCECPGKCLGRNCCCCGPSLRPSIYWLYNTVYSCCICVSENVQRSGWWFGTFFYFPIYWEFHHPNWLICFRGVGSTTNQFT